MTSIANYNEGLKRRIEWLKTALDNKDEIGIQAHCAGLFGYLEGLDWFAEEEKKNDQYERGFAEGWNVGNGEMKDWKFCPICGRPLYVVRGRLTCQECV